MERTKVHNLLGFRDDDFEKIICSVRAFEKKQTASKDSQNRETYSINASFCGNGLIWLDIDYRQDRVLRYRYKLIDQTGGWVYDSRPPDLALECVDTPRSEIDPERGVIGLQEAFQDKKVIAYHMTPGLPTAEDGIHESAEILAIDGKSVAGESYDSFPKRLVGPPGSSVTIKIRRGKLIDDIKIRRMWVGDIADFRTRCQFLHGD